METNIFSRRECAGERDVSAAGVMARIRLLAGDLLDLNAVVSTRGEYKTAQELRMANDSLGRMRETLECLRESFEKRDELVEAGEK